MDELLLKAAAYAELRNLSIRERLGFGIHGTVFLAESKLKTAGCAVKFHREIEPFERERDVYQRLMEHHINQIEGFEVPQLLASDEEFLALEMTIVQPPFLLDFGGAYLDAPPEFPDSIWEEWREQKAEEFDDRWPVVEDVLMTLRGYGIYLVDIHARNITFRET